MCTLTFYPKPNNDGFILTFNRDEMADRSTVDIIQDSKRGLIYPKDALHGGTWLALSQRNGRFTCLLNGAFERHERRLPYRKSRGLMLLESFEYDDVLDFCKQYDLTNIEPFTMITGQDDVFYELRWDGAARHILLLDRHKPKIWSSCTLYNAAVRSQRAQWFSSFLKNKNIKKPASDLWQFHETARPEAPENSILMRRETGPSTVSITQLNFISSSQIIDFQYYELGKHVNHHHRIVYEEQFV
jgi:hypothetical protein